MNKILIQNVISELLTTREIIEFHEKNSKDITELKQNITKEILELSKQIKN